jgi:hypothetical protein
LANRFDAFVYSLEVYSNSSSTSNEDEWQSSFRAAALDDYQAMTSAIRINPIRFVGNPLNAFYLIRKYTKDLDSFLMSNKDKSDDNEAAMISKRSRIVEYLRSKHRPVPDMDDLVGAMKALFRLEAIYSIKPADLVRGVFSKKYSAFAAYRPLNMAELLDLSRFAFEMADDYYHGSLFLNETFNLYETTKTTKSTEVTESEYFKFILTASEMSLNEKNLDYGRFLLEKFRSYGAIVEKWSLEKRFNFLERMMNEDNSTATRTKISLKRFQRSFYLEKNFDHNYVRLCSLDRNVQVGSSSYQSSFDLNFLQFLLLFFVEFNTIWAPLRLCKLSSVSTDRAG